MRNKLLPVLYFLLLAADLILISIHDERSRIFTKPLLMPVLAVYLIRSVFFGYLAAWFALGSLFWAWLGDLFLLFDWYSPFMFLYGLGCFLTAHIFYVVAFMSLASKKEIRTNSWMVLIAMLYYFILIRILSPHLYELTWPVRIYGLILTFMLIVAMQVGKAISGREGLYMIIGAVTFVISDSLLAFNMFHTEFAGAGILIMLTYGIAQFLIIRSVILRLQKVLSHPK